MPYLEARQPVGERGGDAATRPGAPGRGPSPARASPRTPRTGAAHQPCRCPRSARGPPQPTAAGRPMPSGRRPGGARPAGRAPGSAPGPAARVRCGRASRRPGHGRRRPERLHDAVGRCARRTRRGCPRSLLTPRSARPTAWSTFRRRRARRSWSRRPAPAVTDTCSGTRPRTGPPQRRVMHQGLRGEQPEPRAEQHVGGSRARRGTVAGRDVQHRSAWLHLQVEAGRAGVLDEGARRCRPGAASDQRPSVPAERPAVRLDLRAARSRRTVSTSASSPAAASAEQRRQPRDIAVDEHAFAAVVTARIRSRPGRARRR